MTDFNDLEYFYGNPDRNPVALPQRQAGAYLREHVNSRFLKQPRKTPEYQVEDQTFRSNNAFWETTLHLSTYVGLRIVRLENFQITDWYPRAPGLAFTLAASNWRREASKFLRKGSLDSYTPTGKEFMIKGGIGSYRFAPFEYHDTTYHLATATTDSFCHTGIPLAVPEAIIRNVDFFRGCNITGRYQIIPDPIRSYFRHLQGVPKFYFLVEEIIQTEDHFGPVNITPVIMMRSLNGEKLVSYYTCRADRTEDLDQAAVWLSNYAQRHQAEILTNYDEQRPAFENVPFSLQHLTNDEFELLRLKELGIPLSQVVFHREVIMKKIDQSKKITIKGNNTGNAVIAETIQNSFNHIQQSRASEDIKALLTDLVTKVDEMCKALPEEEAETVKQDLETFTKEATKEKPRKKFLDISVETIKKAAENIRDIGKPVLEIVDKLLPLLLIASQQIH